MDRGRRHSDDAGGLNPPTTGVSTGASSLVRRVILAQEAARFAQSNSKELAPNETGGIVIGHLRGDAMVITRVSGPGPRAVHRSDLFIRDGVYVQAVLDETVAETAGRDDYLGEWHSHPFPEGPSVQDHGSLRRISRNLDYGCPSPVLLLCRRRGRNWRLEAYQWDADHLVRHRLQIRDLGSV
jgi:integrative and conjugative element protein (TIGR02256 family)